MGNSHAELGCCGYDELAEKPPTTQPIRFPRVRVNNIARKANEPGVTRRIASMSGNGSISMVHLGQTLRTPFAPNYFQPGFHLAQSGFESLSPERKAALLDDRIDETLRLHTKVMDAIKKYGGLGERLRTVLGPDYDNFVMAFYAQSGLSQKAIRLSEAVNDPEMAARLDAQDELTVTQWRKAVGIMDEILAKHLSPEATASPFPTTTALAVGGLAAAGLVALLALG